MRLFFGHNHTFGSEPATLGYGLLYNWYAASDANLAPTDWKVPTHAELGALSTYLGGNTVSGGKLKEAGLSHWRNPNTGADNSSGFTGLPGGLRYDTGNFTDMLSYGHLWSSTSYSAIYSRRWTIYYNSIIASYNASPIAQGCSVRLLYTGVGAPTTVTDFDGNVYDVVKIGNQYWTVQNWKCKHLNNGTAIPEVTGNAAWAALTSGAWCYYNNDPNNQ
jgi:uncharacterized protein (TIGR02145 family)